MSFVYLMDTIHDTSLKLKNASWVPVAPMVSYAVESWVGAITNRWMDDINNPSPSVRAVLVDIYEECDDEL